MAATSVEREIVDLESEYWRAIRDRDTDAAIHLTDDHCIVVGAQGAATIGREQFASMLNSPTWTLHEFEFDATPQVRLPAEDVATIAYTVTEKLTVEGKPVTLKAADASTWVRRSGRWVCALHTESVLGDPFGRDRAS